ncbi:MAG: RNA 2'-phosphotransferase [Oscillospiraceae bacterium]|nr:RNA 2'-phosphotransferase [Oscillospiraceae bacterium]
MDYTQLSKEISYALRHNPQAYGLKLDENGWVDENMLLRALHKNEKFRRVTSDDIKNAVKSSDKKRHEIKDGKIRALYGHSVSVRIEKELSEPPEILYHGTARDSLASIIKTGLTSQSRQYVHLSTDTITALNVGKRHDSKPVMLKIDAKQAWDDGVKFYIGNDKVWLADEIPAKYISVKL